MEQKVQISIFHCVLNLWVILKLKSYCYFYCCSHCRSSHNHVGITDGKKL